MVNYDSLICSAATRHPHRRLQMPSADQAIAEWYRAANPAAALSIQDPNVVLLEGLPAVLTRLYLKDCTARTFLPPLPLSPSSAAQAAQPWRPLGTCPDRFVLLGVRGAADARGLAGHPCRPGLLQLCGANNAGAADACRLNRYVLRQVHVSDRIKLKLRSNLPELPEPCRLHGFLAPHTTAPACHLHSAALSVYPHPCLSLANANLFPHAVQFSASLLTSRSCRVLNVQITFAWRHSGTVSGKQLTLA